MRARRPSLRFSPVAWSKLLFLRDQGSTEVGGFGITPADDLLYVEDVSLLRQTCTAVSVKFDDAAVAEYFEEQVTAGRKPEQFARVWIHTHPADSAEPSHVDERTFRCVFGRCDWSVMFILAEGGQTYARIRYGVGPGGAMKIPVKVDFSRPFAGSDAVTWQREYTASVTALEFSPISKTPRPSTSQDPLLRESPIEELLFDQFNQERSDLAYSEPI